MWSQISMMHLCHWIITQESIKKITFNLKLEFKKGTIFGSKVTKSTSDVMTIDIFEIFKRIVKIHI